MSEKDWSFDSLDLWNPLTWFGLFIIACYIICYGVFVLLKKVKKKLRKKGKG